MEKRELICIGCPLGCMMNVLIDGKTVSVSGHTCPRGESYAKREVLSPTRIVTSTVRLLGGSVPRVSVKTASDIPKDKIFAVMEEIHQASVQTPVRIGDVIISNCAGTGSAVIATRQADVV